MARKKPTKRKRELSPVDWHQRNVARSVLKTNDIMNAVLGGPSRSQAKRIIRRIG